MPGLYPSHSCSSTAQPLHFGDRQETAVTHRSCRSVHRYSLLTREHISFTSTWQVPTDMVMMAPEDNEPLQSGTRQRGLPSFYFVLALTCTIPSLFFLLKFSSTLRFSYLARQNSSLLHIHKKPNKKSQFPFEFLSFFSLHHCPVSQSLSVIFPALLLVTKVISLNNLLCCSLLSCHF